MENNKANLLVTRNQICSLLGIGYGNVNELIENSGIRPVCGANSKVPKYRWADFINLLEPTTNGNGHSMGPEVVIPQPAAKPIKPAPIPTAAVTMQIAAPDLEQFRKIGKAQGKSLSALMREMVRKLIDDFNQTF